MARLPDLLEKSTMPEVDKLFIAAKVTADVYNYVTVKLYLEDGQQILEIDEFNYDEWANSVTGERGKSPHGTCTKYRKIDDDWDAQKITHYGG